MPDFWTHLQKPSQSLCPHSDTKLLRCIAFGELPFRRNSLVIATPAGLLFCSPCRCRTDVGYVPSPVRTGIWAEVGTWLLLQVLQREQDAGDLQLSIRERGLWWNGPVDGRERQDQAAKQGMRRKTYNSVQRFWLSIYHIVVSTGSAENTK